MIKSLLRFFRKKPRKEERRITKYPIVLETYGLLESRNPTVDTAYGTITYIYEDGTREVYNKVV